MLAFLIAWLVLAIPNPQFLGNLTNEQVAIASYAKQRAEQYEVNPELFIRLIFCESRFQNAKGDYRSETDIYMARGILQFWKGTFVNYSRTFNFKGEYLNPYDQIDLALLIITKEVRGLYHWRNCSRAVGFLPASP